MNLEANVTKTLGNNQPENDSETDMNRLRPELEEMEIESVHLDLKYTKSEAERSAALDKLISLEEEGKAPLQTLKKLAGCHVPVTPKKCRIIKHNGIAVRLVMPDVPTAEQVREEKRLAKAIYPQGEGDVNKIREGLSPADRSAFETALEKEDWKTTDDIVSLSLKAAKYAREKAAAKVKAIGARRAVRFVPIRNRARAQVRRAPRSVKHAAKASVAASSPGGGSGDSSGGAEPPSGDPDLPRPHDRRLTPSAVPFRDGVSQVSFNENLIPHTQTGEMSALLSAYALSQIVGGCSR